MATVSPFRTMLFPSILVGKIWPRKIKFVKPGANSTRNAAIESSGVFGMRDTRNHPDMGPHALRYPGVLFENVGIQMRWSHHHYGDFRRGDWNSVGILCLCGRQGRGAGERSSKDARLQPMLRYVADRCRGDRVVEAIMLEEPRLGPRRNQSRQLTCLQRTLHHSDDSAKDENPASRDEAWGDVIGRVGE